MDNELRIPRNCKQFLSHSLGGKKGFFGGNEENSMFLMLLAELPCSARAKRWEADRGDTRSMRESGAVVRRLRGSLQSEILAPTTHTHTPKKTRVHVCQFPWCKRSHRGRFRCHLCDISEHGVSSYSHCHQLVLHSAFLVPT